MLVNHPIDRTSVKEFKNSIFFILSLYRQGFPSLVEELVGISGDCRWVLVRVDEHAHPVVLALDSVDLIVGIGIGAEDHVPVGRVGHG